MPKKNPAQGRSLTFSFSPAGLFALLLFAIIALAWAFIFGLLLGRGYQPEELIPEIAQIMPTPPPPPNVTESLRPEDLNFYEQLKNMPIKDEPVTATSKQARLLPKKEKSSQPPKTRKTDKNDKRSLSKKRKTTAQKQQEVDVKPKVQQLQLKTTNKKTQRPVPKKETTRFFYRYQISSLRDGAAALGVQKKLEAKGIAASITKINVKGKNWYRIFVEIKGNEQDVKATTVKLKKMGFPDMILANKKRLN